MILTHFCAMISVQSGVLSLITGNLFFLCARVMNQILTSHIIDTYLLLDCGGDVWETLAVLSLCSCIVLQNSLVNLSDRLFVLEKQ